MNIVPSARMDPSGTITAGVSTLDPYLHGYLGFQIAAPLHINLRQSALTSNFRHEAERLYPGLDTKLRLVKENEYLPEISLGLNSAIGHKRMAAEYIAFSKRYKQFDFTGGLGWGRMGTAGHFKNPFKSISSHFGKSRDYDGELSASPDDWFTGETIGFFGGVEYFPPALPPLSIKLDLGSDRYEAEQSSFDYDVPVPWSLGFNFKPAAWVDFGVAAHGLDKFMGRVTFRGAPSDWPFTASEKPKSAVFTPHRTSGSGSPSAMQTDAHKDGVLLYNTKRDGAIISSGLDLEPHHSTPRQLRMAATNIANNAGAEIETIALRPSKYNLKGPLITLNRRDLENALGRNQGSADEIWRNTEISADAETANAKTSPYAISQFKLDHLHFILDNRVSMAEEDSGALFRSSVVSDLQGPSFFGLIHSGFSMRLNLGNNLERLEEIRPPQLFSVRSDVYAFADDVIALDANYIAATYSFTPEIHAALTGGYLEEMYGGFGGEILYRPFGKRFAFGADGWVALKRNPYTPLHTGFRGDGTLTGHLNGWYDFPESDTVLQVRIGRFLAQDIGASLSLQKNFENGASLSGFVTVTDNADFDLFGGTTHAYNGMRLSLPLGGVPYIPDGSEARFEAAPFGRDMGQALSLPFTLFEATDGFSYDHLARNWHEISE